MPLSASKTRLMYALQDAVALIALMAALGGALVIVWGFAA
jgi:hypothetical protein